MELFKKSVTVGVSVTPELGLEMAMVDFETQTLLKYGCKPLDYDINTQQIADIDKFKEALQDLLMELQIPKGAEINLNIPAVVFKAKDYPASLELSQVAGVVEEELNEHYIFQHEEPAISTAILPNSTIQFNKVAYTAAQKQTLIEIAMGIKELGYKINSIDTSVNSTFNALMYKQRVDVSPDKAWILLLVDNVCCRVLTMNGKNYVDSIEEKISIGSMFDDAENYSNVVNALTPILRNIPSQYLCVVSKTNIISAEVLASKLQYSAPIIHQEANSYSKEMLLECAPGVDMEIAKSISMDVIGAAINKNFEHFSNVHLNLYNSSLGDIYNLEQPLEIYFGGKLWKLTNSFMATVFLIIAVPIIVITIILYGYYASIVNNYNAELQKIENEIQVVNKFLKENESISAELFDEGDEIRIGLVRNKGIYSYYTIMGTEIPKKLWLTHLKFGDKTTIEGQADNLESVYSFFRNIKDYNPNSEIKLQKLGLATKGNIVQSEDGSFDTDTILTSLNADFYEFKISDEVNMPQQNTNSIGVELPGLEPIKETN